MACVAFASNLIAIQVNFVFNGLHIIVYSVTDFNTISEEDKVGDYIFISKELFQIS